MKIYTGRIGNAYKDELDITAKSAQGDGKVLAPTWDLVMDHKAHRITDLQYVDAYVNLIRQRYLQDKTPFLRILSNPSVTLTCYCRPNAFCHRRIAQDILVKIALAHGLKAVWLGEH